MRYYPVDSPTDCRLQPRLPLRLSPHRIRGSRLCYGTGSWGEYVSQWGKINESSYEHCYGDLKRSLELVCQRSSAITGLLYGLKGRFLIEGADERIEKGGCYLIHFPRGAQRLQLQEGICCWFLLMPGSPCLRLFSRNIDGVANFLAAIPTGGVRLQRIGAVTSYCRQLIHSICATCGQSPELELRRGALVQSLLSAAADTLRNAGKKAPAAVDRESLEQFMLERLDSTVTVHMIARAFALNETAVKRLFRSLFGRTVHAYVLEQRLKLAARLLQTTRDPVYAIALRTGFTDGSHFIKRFRERFGVTPEVYRKK